MYGGVRLGGGVVKACLRCGERAFSAWDEIRCPRCLMTYYVVESDTGIMTMLYRLDAESELKMVPDGCLGVFNSEVVL